MAEQLIHNTPFTSLDAVVKAHFADRYSAQELERVHLWGKCEFMNPGGSKKDRVALEIIKNAERDGKLVNASCVVELTSGNTGTGLAIVCACRGYKFVAVMSKGNSIERKVQMEALGAEVVLVDTAAASSEGCGVSGASLALVETATQKIVTSRGGFRADQFRNRANFLAHYEHTGQEIIKQFESMVGDVPLNAFCDLVGSGGSFAGVSEALRSHSLHQKHVKCYIVEPLRAAVLAGNVDVSTAKSTTHGIQGGGYAMNFDQLPLLQNTAAPDGFLQVADDEAKEVSGVLARTCGLFCGPSAGANVSAALKLIEQHLRSELKDTEFHVAVLLCDTGLKYMSTDLWVRR